MKKISLLLVLAFVAMSANLFAQSCSDLSVVETPPAILSAGTTVTLQYTITNSNTGAGFTLVTNTLHLPLGISFASLNIVGTTAGISTSSTAGSTDPVFSLPAIAAGGSVTISIQAITPCVYDPLRPTITSMDFSATTLSGCTYTMTNNMTLQAGSMSVSISNSTLNLNVGDEQDLAFKVNNSGAGIIPSFDVNCTADPGTSILGYCLSTSITPCAGPLSTISGGIIHVTTAELQSLLPPNGLGQGQFIYVHIKVKVLNCSNTGNGSYVFSWGSPTSCQSPVIMNTDINSIPGAPAMLVTTLSTFTNSSYCPGGQPTELGFIYTNTGVPIGGVNPPPPGNAKLIDLDVYVMCDAQMGSIDINSFRVNGNATVLPVSIIGPVFVVSGYTIYKIAFSALDVSAFSGAHPFGANTLDDVDGDGKLDDLVEGNNFKLTFDYMYTTTCPLEFETYGKWPAVATQTRFQNQCGTMTPPDMHVMPFSITYGGEAQYTYGSNDNGSVMTAPPDVVEGEPFSIEICPHASQTWQPINFDFNCPNGYHQFRVNLPPGYHIAPGVTTITIPVTNTCSGIPVPPLNASVTEYPPVGATPGYLLINSTRIPTGNCSWLAVTYSVECFTVPLSFECVTNPLTQNFGFDDISFTYEYVCDPSCSTCIDHIGGATVTTYHHCSGSCDMPFKTVQNTMSFKRTTLGLINPTSSLYGCGAMTSATQVPATSPVINLEAAYPGDAIEMKLEGGFVGTNGGAYESMFLQLRYDKFPTSEVSTEDIFIQDPGIPSTVQVTSVLMPSLNGTYPLAYTYTTAAPADPLITMNFELPSTLLPLLTSGDAEFKATVHLIAKSSPRTTADATFFTYGRHKVESLRAEFGGAQIPVGGTVATDTTLSCDSWGANFTMLQPYARIYYYPGPSYNPVSDCSPYFVQFVFRSQSALWGSHIEDFPNEFRPYAAMDDNITVTLPPGYDYVSSSYVIGSMTYAATPATNYYGVGPNYQSIPVTPTVTAGPSGTTLAFTGINSTNHCWPLTDTKVATYDASIRVDMQPKCDAPASSGFTINGGYTQSYQQTNPAFMFHTAVNDVHPVYHANPVLTVTAPPTVNALNNTLNIDFSFCNSNDHAAPNSWISFSNPAGVYAITGLMLLPSMASLPVIPYPGGILVNTGNIPPSTCLNLRLTGTITTAGCGAVHDDVIVKWGNECSAPVTAGTEALCEQGTTTFGFNTYPSTITMTPLSGFPDTPVTPCNGSLTYNFVIEDPSLAFVSNPQFWMQLPAGINFTSATFTYPYGQPSATSVTSTTPATGFGIGGTGLGWNLSALFPAVYPAGLADGLSGTSSLNNKIGVTLTVATTCAYSGTEYLQYYTGGTSACSELLSPLPQEHLPSMTSYACCSPCVANAGADVTICENSTATLTATGGSTGYLWSPGGATTATISVMLTSTTTYTVTVYNEEISCTDLVTVFVNPAPSVAVNHGKKVICEGGSITMTATGALTYTWVPSPFGTTLYGSTVTASPTVTTTYIVTGTDANGCSNTTSVTVTVYAMPVVAVTAPVTICPGASTTLTASSATSYAWGSTPASLLPFTASITVSPTTTTTYTVTGANGACSATAVTTVTVAPLPVIVTAPLTICRGQSTTLNASGATTYTWLSTPASTIPATASVTVTPASITTYTVTGTTGSCSATATTTVTVIPLPIVTLTATPSSICSGQTTTLLGSTGSSYGWTSSSAPVPSGGPSVIMSPTATTTYTLTQTSHGCSNSASVTVTVNPLPNVTASASSTKLCAGLPTTLSATGASTYSWSAGTTPATGTPVTATPTTSPTTTYTVTGTTAAGCSATATIAITVYPAAAVNLTSGSDTLCIGQTTTLTATSAGTSSFYWQALPPGVSPTGTSGTVTVSPVATTTYIVTVQNQYGCKGSDTIIVYVKDCGCKNDHYLPASADNNLISSDPASNAAYSMLGNTVISGNILFRDMSLQMATGVKITVPSGSTLTIKHSHLWACDQMWQGIVVENGGKLIIKDTSLIEDADTAVFIATTSFTAPANMSLTVENTIFNKNFIGVKIDPYSQNTATYPYSITGTIFTSRKLNYVTAAPYNVATAWTTPYNLKVLQSTGTLSERYINDGTYVKILLLTKAPYAGQPARSGVSLNGVGYTSGAIYRGIQVGAVSGTALNTLNIYDNLVYGIYAINSTFTSNHSMYQSMTSYGHGGGTGGVGIYGKCADNIVRRATVTSPATTVTTVPSTTGAIAAYSNEFYNARTAISLDNYTDVIINAASARSDQTGNPMTVLFNGPAYMGFTVTTNQYKNIRITANRVTNINNGVIFKVGAYLIGTAGPVNIDVNLLQSDYTSPAGSGHWINNAIAASSIVIPTALSSNVISTSGNKLVNVYEGIYTSNWQKQSSVSENNTITMTAYGTGVAYTQRGIFHENNVNNIIRYNNVSGTNTTTNNKEECIGILSRTNAKETVSCNTVANIGHGIEFEGLHPGPVYFMDNTLNPCKRGYVLSNSGQIGAQTGPTSSLASDNRWLGTWTSSMSQTYVIGSNPVLSKLSVRAGAAYTPVYNGLSGAGSAYSSATMPTVGSPGTLRTCTVPVVGGCAGCQTSLFEGIVMGTFTYPTWPTQTGIIGKHKVFRTLEEDPSLMSGSAILTNFYAVTKSTSIDVLSDIEEDLALNNFSAAAAKISALAAANNIERSYKTLYDIVVKTAVDTTISPADSAALVTLANGCPGTDGPSVIQARALLNVICKCYRTYEDHCPASRSAGIADAEEKRPLNYMVYPNPAKDEVYISVSDADLKEAIIEVCDITGKRVMMKQVNLEGGIGRLELDVQNGVYFISIDDVQKNKVFTQKIIIAK